MDHIKISGHTDQIIFTGDENNLFVVGRPCGRLDTAVYASHDLDLWLSALGQLRKPRRTGAADPSGPWSASVAMSPPARRMTRERSSGR